MTLRFPGDASACRCRLLMLRVERVNARRLLTKTQARSRRAGTAAGERRRLQQQRSGSSRRLIPTLQRHRGSCWSPCQPCRCSSSRYPPLCLRWLYPGCLCRRGKLAQYVPRQQHMQGVGAYLHAAAGASNSIVSGAAVQPPLRAALEQRRRCVTQGRRCSCGEQASALGRSEAVRSCVVVLCAIPERLGSRDGQNSR